MAERVGPSVATDGPWFGRHPQATLVVAASLFVGVLGLRFALPTPADAVSLLYCLPVALVAVAFGRRAGIVAGVVGIGLLAVWALSTLVALPPTGWATRALPLLLLGWLLGDATDRAAAAEHTVRRLQIAATRHRDAVELNDSVVQGLAAAKWALEAGRFDSALQVVNQTLESAQALVSDLLHDAAKAPGAASALTVTHPLAAQRP